MSSSNLARRAVPGAPPTDARIFELPLNPHRLREFYVHVLTNHRLVEPNSEESYQCTSEGYLAVLFHIDLNEENTPPTMAALVLSSVHERAVSHKRGAEVYRVHILDIGKFADEKTCQALRLLITDTFTQQHGLVTQKLVTALARVSQT